MTNNDAERWATYYQATKDNTPRDTLLKALSLFSAEPSDQPRLAIDLGCGGGVDTVELLRQGWRVLAIDAQPGAIELVRARISPQQQERLQTRVATFEEIGSLPQADLVNASFSLPFCSPGAFDVLWDTIVSALSQGGRFSGHLFGDRDGWASRPSMTFHTRAQIERRLSHFAVEMLNEEEVDGQTALGDPKHWHTFSIVARKR
jgi:tellurite methyltransferase